MQLNYNGQSVNITGFSVTEEYDQMEVKRLMFTATWMQPAYQAAFGAQVGAGVGTLSTDSGDYEIEFVEQIESTSDLIKFSINSLKKVVGL